MNIQLSFAMAPNPRNRAIFDGRVSPDGIDLVCNEVGPSELFWRQLRHAEFDISEMSISSLLISLANGDDRWIGLPVFTTRRFFHASALARRDSGIDSPADFKGRRIGVPEFQQTAALWARGALKHEFGVDQTKVEWWMERTPEHSHGGATGFRPPPGTTVNQIPADKNIGSMLLSGELDATIIFFEGGGSNNIDRSVGNLHEHLDIRSVFADPSAEGIRYYNKTGIYPINHAMMIRRSVAETYPWVITNIYKAMVEANIVAERERVEHVHYHLECGLLPPEMRSAVETTLIEHGIAANRRTLETACAYSQEQGLTSRVLALDEIFAGSTLDE